MTTIKKEGLFITILPWLLLLIVVIGILSSFFLPKTLGLRLVSDTLVTLEDSRQGIVQEEFVPLPVSSGLSLPCVWVGIIEVESETLSAYAEISNIPLRKGDRVLIQSVKLKKQITPTFWARKIIERPKELAPPGL